MVALARTTPAALAAALALLGAACAAPAASRVRDAPASYAHPEPDRRCNETVQAPLLAHGLELVTVKLALDPRGKPTVVEFLSPDLSPAAMLELRLAFERCLWKPDVTPDGAKAWTTTFVRLRQ